MFRSFKIERVDLTTYVRVKHVLDSNRFKLITAYLEVTTCQAERTSHAARLSHGGS
jgi:hypothetical protein